MTKQQDNIFKEKKFAASAVEINYAEGPDNGPPVVLIHGLGGRWTNWEPVMHGVAGQWHVYAIDLRGHGDSGRVSNGYGFNDYSIEVIEFLRKVVGRPAYLVGHSLGGVTAASVCASAPDLVAAAVLEDPPLYIADGLTSRALHRCSRGSSIFATRISMKKPLR